ncbi:MAG: hypothetical protein ACXAEU_11850 [Candidatus Hodarchaeales archaeon]
MTSHLLSLWLGLDVDQKKVIRISTKRTVDIRELCSAYSTLDRFVYNLESSIDRETIKWLGSPPEKWNDRRIIRPFMRETTQVLENLGQRRGQTVDKIDILREGIINVFFRLTTYNSGAIVPIRDLTGLETAIHISSLFYKRTNLSDELNRYQAKWSWNKVVSGILFSLYCEGMQFPAPYYPKLSALERKDELNETLRELEESYTELFTRTGRKMEK